jgi:tetratricopeptide (TPR) repeat protein
MLHLAAGSWLESVGDADVGLIARHADAGGDLERAAALYARATRQAYTHGALLETALYLAERGLACGAQGGVRAQLLLSKAQVSHSLGLLPQAVQSAEQAADCAPEGSDMWGEAQRLASIALIESGRSAEGDARAVAALESSSLSAPIRATLLAARVRGLIDLNRPAEAIAIAHHAVDAAQRSGSLDAMVRALDARLYVLLHAGDLSVVATAGSALIDTAESAGDIVSATRARLNIGSALNHLGMFEQAQALLERALTDSRARRMRILEAFSLHNLGMSHARLGDLDAGIDYQRQAQRIADECNAARLRIHSRVYEIIFLVWRGAPGDLSTALSLARYVQHEALSVPSQQVTAAFALARVQLARRAFDAALESARDAMQLLDSGPVEEWEEYTRLTFVESLLAVGEDDEADTALRVAFDALVTRVRSISHPEHRDAFMRRNEEVYRIAELAYGRLGRTFPQ